MIEDRCIVCLKSDKNLVNGTKSGIETLVKTATILKDSLYKNLHEYYTSVETLHLQEGITVQYHRDCYKNYSYKFVELQNEESKSSSIDTVLVRNTRQQNPINWAACLICGKRKHRGNTKLHKSNQKIVNKPLKILQQQKMIL